MTLWLSLLRTNSVMKCNHSLNWGETMEGWASSDIFLCMGLLQWLSGIVYLTIWRSQVSIGFQELMKQKKNKITPKTQRCAAALENIIHHFKNNSLVTARGMITDHTQLSARSQFIFLIIQKLGAELYHTEIKWII